MNGIIERLPRDHQSAGNSSELSTTAILRDRSDITTYYSYIANKAGQTKPHFMNFGRTGPASPGANLISHLTTGLQLRDASVIEFGCGRGGNLDFIHRSRQAQHCVGVDITPAQIRLATTSFPECTFIVGDSQSWSYTTEFDFALCVESLLHYSDLDGFASGVASSLRTGGTLIVWDFFDGERLKHFVEACGAVGLVPSMKADESAAVLDGWRRRHDPTLVDMNHIITKLATSTGTIEHLRLTRV